MTATEPSTEDRYAAIIALAQTRPELSYKVIGARFGVSAAYVSQIIAGKRGKRRQTRLDRLLQENTHDAEFGAIRAVIAALAPLEEPARERVTQYALARLRDLPQNEPTYSDSQGTTKAPASSPFVERAGAVGRQNG